MELAFFSTRNLPFTSVASHYLAIKGFDVNDHSNIFLRESGKVEDGKWVRGRGR